MNDARLQVRWQYPYRFDRVTDEVKWSIRGKLSQTGAKLVGEHCATNRNTQNPTK